MTLGDNAGYTLPDRRGAGLKFGYGAHRRRARPEIDGFGSDLAAEGEAILAPFRPYVRDAGDYRPTRIQVRALNRQGKPFELAAEGFLARAVCHEIDHLNGILFTDHLRGLRKERMKRQLKRLASGAPAADSTAEVRS